MAADELRAWSAARKLAARQQGVITLGQVIAAGVTARAFHRRAMLGEWERVYEGIYRLAGSPRGRLQQLRLVSLWAGDRAALSHFSAAEIWRMDGIPRRTWVDVLQGRWSRTPPQGSIEIRAHRARDFDARKPVKRDGFLITSVRETLVDLAAEVGDAELELAILDAIRRHLLSTESLRAWLQTLPGMGVRSIRRLREVANAHHVQEVESPLEARFLQALAQEGLPTPEAQFRLMHEGTLLGRFDFAYSTARLVIELDSRKHHERVLAFDTDRARDNSLLAIGWRTFRVTQAALRRKRKLTFDQLRRTLAGPADVDAALARNQVLASSDLFQRGAPEGRLAPCPSPPSEIAASGPGAHPPPV